MSQARTNSNNQSSSNKENVTTTDQDSEKNKIKSLPESNNKDNSVGDLNVNDQDKIVVLHNNSESNASSSKSENNKDTRVILRELKNQSLIDLKTMDLKEKAEAHQYERNNHLINGFIQITAVGFEQVGKLMLQKDIEVTKRHIADASFRHKAEIKRIEEEFNLAREKVYNEKCNQIKASNRLDFELCKNTSNDLFERTTKHLEKNIDLLTSRLGKYDDALINSNSNEKMNQLSQLIDGIKQDIEKVNRKIEENIITLKAETANLIINFNQLTIAQNNQNILLNSIVPHVLSNNTTQLQATNQNRLFSGHNININHVDQGHNNQPNAENEQISNSPSNP